MLLASGTWRVRYANRRLRRVEAKRSPERPGPVRGDARKAWNAGKQETAFGESGDWLRERRKSGEKTLDRVGSPRHEGLVMLYPDHGKETNSTKENGGHDGR
jgi:hypothetical protein